MKLRRFLFFLVLGFLSSLVMAEACTAIYTDATDALDAIEIKLQATDSKSDYQKSVRARFDKVEQLLLASESCEKPLVLDKAFVQRWHQMYMTLTALQASAQLSAFTEFDNWLNSKQKDLTAFDYAKQSKW